VANTIKGLGSGSIGPDAGNPVEKIRGSAPVGAPATGPSSHPPSQDSVHITASARLLASLSQAVNSAPDVDAARVAAVQQAISAGQYRINPERIANRLLQLEQDLGGAAHQ
jgi:negative regulator of flagellin synthesis FlgM